MSKIDFEKDRRRRLRRDVCADAPWRNELASVVARLGPRFEASSSEVDRRARKKSPSVFVPRLEDVTERLRLMARRLRDACFRHYAPWEKLKELNDIQKRMARIVEIEGRAIKSTREYKLVESACRRQAEALHRLAKQERK